MAVEGSGELQSISSSLGIGSVQPRSAKAAIKSPDAFFPEAELQAFMLILLVLVLVAHMYVKVCTCIAELLQEVLWRTNPSKKVSPSKSDDARKLASVPMKTNLAATLMVQRMYLPTRRMKSESTS